MTKKLEGQKAQDTYNYNQMELQNKKRGTILRDSVTSLSQKKVQAPTEAFSRGSTPIQRSTAWDQN
jgi:hypothetical protein